MERLSVKKIYIDDNDCADLSSLLIRSETLLMVSRRFITLLCHLDYPPETLSSPIYKGLIARATEAVKAFEEKREEIVEKYCTERPVPFNTINVATGTLALRDGLAQTIIKDMTGEVEEGYRGAVQRYNFIVNREVDNVSFLMLQHFEDKDDSFLDSEIVKKRIKNLEEADIQRLRFESGTAALIFDNESVETLQYISFSRYSEKVRMIV